MASRAHIPECSIDECTNGARSTRQPLCEMHYGRMRRYGATEPGVCAYCGGGKPHERSIYCSRACGLRMDRARRYGLTADQALAYEATREGRCDICGRLVEGPKGLHWDHDHETNELRGLLCSPCNTGLGMFGDDVARLRAAVEYLDLGR